MVKRNASASGADVKSLGEFDELDSQSVGAPQKKQGSGCESVGLAVVGRRAPIFESSKFD